MCEYAIRITDKAGHHVKFFWRQMNLAPAYERPMTLDFDSEIACLDHAVLDLRVAVHTPHLHAYSGEQLLHAEWFREVVIRAFIQRRDLGCFLIANGKDDDRRRGSHPNFPRQFDAVHLGHTNVRDHKIRLTLQKHPQSGSPIMRDADLVPAALQRCS